MQQARSLEFRRMLCLSTAHLPEGLLNSLPWREDVVAWSAPYGIIMWVPDDPDDSAEADEPGPEPQVLELQRFARGHHCDYVILDCDGPRIPELPVWEW